MAALSRPQGAALPLKVTTFRKKEMPTSIEALQQLLLSLNRIPAEKSAALFESTEMRHLNLNEVYIAQGATTRKLAFIEKGIMRACGFKDNGDDATLFLRWEGQLAASHDTIVSGEPSRFIYQAIEPVTLCWRSITTRWTGS